MEPDRSNVGQLSDTGARTAESIKNAAVFSAASVRLRFQVEAPNGRIA